MSDLTRGPLSPAGMVRDVYSRRKWAGIRAECARLVRAQAASGAMHRRAGALTARAVRAARRGQAGGDR